MVRTQIYITQKQYRVLTQKAAVEKTTVSQLIRNLVDRQLSEGKSQYKRKNAGSVLLEMARDAKRLNLKGPSDLASNVDTYLYGEKAK